MSNGTITVRPVSEIASCNACIARNYDPTSGWSAGKRVDTLYRIHVSSGSSGIAICLCRDCLSKLIGEAAIACASGKGEEI